MGAILFGIGGLVLLSFLSSTREQRDEARERMKPIGRASLPFTIAMWVFLAWLFWLGSRQ